MLASIKQKLFMAVLTMPIAVMGMAFAISPVVFAGTTIPGDNSSSTSSGAAPDSTLLGIYKNQICDPLKQSDNVSCDDNPSTQSALTADEKSLCNQYPNRAASGCQLYSQTVSEQQKASALASVPGGDVCGNDPATKIAINIGCTGKGNPILDMVFAVVRWLSDGVGLVIIASVIVGGIQYSTSRDNPQGVQTAVNRLRTSVGALLLFIFSYAILNYLIPGAILK